MGYRFKTEEEFIKEFGKNWRYSLGNNCFPHGMNYLLGKSFPYKFEGDQGYNLNINNEKETNINKHTWVIIKNMLIKELKPDYRPKRKRN